MTRIFGFVLLLIGLCAAQFGGAVAFHGGGGVDMEDVLRFDWFKNIGGNIRGDGMLFLAICAAGVLIAATGLYKLLRGKASA